MKTKRSYLKSRW